MDYTLENYYKFLEDKMDVVEWSGFEIDVGDLHPSTKPHQKDTITWGTRIGRGLIAKSFGLGKTHDQIEIGKQVVKRTDGRFLVICPLGVRRQFIEKDGPRLGIDFRFVSTDYEIETTNSPYLITNYEPVRDGKITPHKHNFAGLSLDEGSVLRSLGSKTYNEFLQIFKQVPYRWVCTATPSPNNFKELLGYAEFLDIMDRGQCLTRFFQRDTSKAGNLTLHPQHEENFWLWVASWALFIYKPSDLGYSDEGYELPKLHVHWHKIPVDHTRAFAQTDSWGQHRMFLDAAAGVREAVAEKRATIDPRVTKMLGIMLEDNREGLPISEGLCTQWVIWCHLNDEQKAIRNTLLKNDISLSSVYGSLTTEEGERRLSEWEDKETDVLLSKPIMLGSGLNLQQSHNMIFVGIDYKFQDFIQAVHRLYRFMQLFDVNVHIIFAESEQQVAMTLKKKWKQHDVLVQKMQGIVKKYGLTHWAIETGLKRNVSDFRDEYRGHFFRLVNTDSTIELFNLVEAMENGATNPFKINIGDRNNGTNKNL